MPSPWPAAIRCVLVRSDTTLIILLFFLLHFLHQHPPQTCHRQPAVPGPSSVATAGRRGHDGHCWPSYCCHCWSCPACSSPCSSLIFCEWPVLLCKWHARRCWRWRPGLLGWCSGEPWTQSALSQSPSPESSSQSVASCQHRRRRRRHPSHQLLALEIHQQHRSNAAVRADLVATNAPRRSRGGKKGHSMYDRFSISWLV